ncbi:hypothetical protein [Novosphingobium sp.]|uniref:hypothetical protein n=1 Tax=Novosphingobium sp. TaxID=1874826 RepID=UPI001DDED830|nr:hypothetical protein [Novosphingobium sp.]MBX9665923.1 hypothetical protein [Novosphingobium sp.]
MKLGYTEFSFGYGFTENLLRWSAKKPAGCPVFPNLIQEASLGYDVRIDLPAAPLFFQFKLPELMTTRRAKEIKVHKLSGLSCDFFRMPLMRRDKSDQHRLLIQLETQFPGRVFYATPVLPTLGRFNAEYNAGRIHQHTAFISPQAIGPLPDDLSHHVSYKTTSSGWFCSEPRPLEIITWDALLSDIESPQKDRPQLELGELMHRVQTSLRELRGDSVRVDERAVRNRVSARRRLRDGAALDPERQKIVDELLVSQEMARIGLGVEMLIAQPQT